MVLRPVEAALSGLSAVFSSFMTNTWIVASVVAVVVGAVGFFTVLRGSAFAAHAIPQGAFAGAAGAVLLGTSTLLGLGVFAVAGALGIGWLGRRARRDVATALGFVLMLAVGALLLSMSQGYEPEIDALLFGQVLGVGSYEVLPTAALGLASVLALILLYRPLLLASVLPDLAGSRGVSTLRTEIAFLVVVGLATAMTVPVVGASLMFSLMIAPAGAARSLTDRPGRALLCSSAISLAVVWASIAGSYASNWPVGFFVGTIGVVVYGLSRAAAARRHRGLQPGAPQLAERSA